MSILRRSKGFVVGALLVMSIVTVSTVGASSSQSHRLAARQEAETLGGGFLCDFNDGVGAGLGVATLFGCVPCGFGAAGAAVVHVLAC